MFAIIAIIVVIAASAWVFRAIDQAEATFNELVSENAKLRSLVEAGQK
jgi:hypothetical protein